MEKFGEAHAQQPATGFRALQRFREENQTDVDSNEKVSVDPNSASFDPVITMHKPRTENRSLPSGQRPLLSPTYCSVVKSNRGMYRDIASTSVVCLSTLEVLPRFGSNLWVSPAELRWTSNESQRLLTDGKVCKTSRPVSVRVLLNLRDCPQLASLDMGRASGTHATIECLVFLKDGCYRGASPRGLNRSCPSAWLDHMHGWSLCNHIPTLCARRAVKNL